MMKTLETKGLIRRKPGVARSIEILVDRDAIPTWQGERFSRAVWQWTFAGARQKLVNESTI